MSYIILGLAALALCEVITATVMVVGMARICDIRKNMKTTDDILNILAGSIAENRGEIRGIKHELSKAHGVTPEKIPVIREVEDRNEYFCETCVYDNNWEVCRACNPDDPLMNCYQKGVSNA